MPTHQPLFTGFTALSSITGFCLLHIENHYQTIGCCIAVLRLGTIVTAIRSVLEQPLAIRFICQWATDKLRSTRWEYNYLH